MIGLIVLLPGIAHADLIINEVMYDLSGSDTDREWVELYNNGSSPVAIVTGSGSGSWRFVDSSPHVLNLVSADPTIPAGQYAIIAKNATQFQSEWPSYSGILFSSSMSLPNTSGNLSLRDGSGATLDPVPYSSDLGAAGDGSSLHRSGASWLAVAPTPGAGDPSNSGASGGNSGTTTTPGPASASSLVPIVRPQLVGDVKLHVPSLVRVHVPAYFWAEAVNAAAPPDLLWNFGDATAMPGTGHLHTYDHVGKYIVTVRAPSLGSQAIARVLIEVTEPRVGLGESVDGPSGSVEIVNETAADVDIGWYNLESGRRSFVIPESTFVAGGDSVFLSNRITGLSYFGDSLSLSAPDGSKVDEKSFVIPERVGQGSVLGTSTEVAVPYRELNEKLTRIRLQAESLRQPPKIQMTKILTVEPVGQSTLVLASATAPVPEASSSLPAPLVIPRKVGLWTKIVGWPRKVITALLH